MTNAPNFCCAPCATAFSQPSCWNYTAALDNAVIRARGILSKSDTCDKVLKLFKSFTELFEKVVAPSESARVAGKLFNGTAKFFAATAVTQDLRYWVDKWEESYKKPDTCDLLFYKRRLTPPAGFASVFLFHVSHTLEMFIFLKEAGFEIGRKVAADIGSWGFFEPKRAIESLKDLIVVGASLAALVDCSTELKKNYVSALKTKARAGLDPNGDELYKNIVEGPDMRGDGLLVDLQIRFRALKQMIYEVYTQGSTKLFPYKTTAKFLANVFKVIAIGLVLQGHVALTSTLIAFILLGFSNALSGDSKEVDTLRKDKELRQSLNKLNERVPKERHIYESFVRLHGLGKN